MKTIITCTLIGAISALLVSCETQSAIHPVTVPSSGQTVNISAAFDPLYGVDGGLIIYFNGQEVTRGIISVAGFTKATGSWHGSDVVAMITEIETTGKPIKQAEISIDEQHVTTISVQ
ncbi:hypothetical protein [Persicirhabdus sediminis]|uniref:Uncharacterized protein n=1 Tax=Persicirhabdus sediminis TaxID=454144 RepID=A0A8J7ME89_9BACT|nr:hypothetical protein [Persicirhabdus sediminis]MBK1791090.1 hypothetical protein [Persicirhabdus sediminis]